MIEDKERAIDRYSIAPFVKLLTPKTKARPSGLHDSNVIFFVATKRGLSIKQEAKENLALRLACLARYHSNINSAKLVRQSSY
jgi:hypothetical protein